MPPSIPPRPVVAIAGATGHLGKYIASAFLCPPLHSQFSEIILLSRKDGPSPQSSDPNTKVYTRKYDQENLADALRGVHILVNTVGSSGHEFKEKLVRALTRTEVQVYFPSEFGVDHYVHDFAHLEWDQKKRHFDLVRELAPDIKVCRVFCGLFLEDSIGPWFGFDTRNGRYKSVGSPDSPVSFTALDDVGRAVASLSTLPREKIPDTVHLAGDTQSMSRIAEIMQTEGAGPIEVAEFPFQKYKDQTTSTSSWDPAAFLRFLMGSGEINHSVSGLGNDNELVNPGGRLWKWASLVDLAKESQGRPWRDFPWPPQ